MSHLTRYHMYKRIEKDLGEKIKGNILCVSGAENIRPLINEEASIMDVQYPEVDMQNMLFDNNTFDCVISDQVIEHVDDPKKAVAESHRILKDGGIAIHTSCFINNVHLCPKDLWRFSPDALKLLCKDFSEIICCGGWGNRFAIVLCFFSNRIRFMKIPDVKWSFRHLIATWNDEKYPIVTWIVAKK